MKKRYYVFLIILLLAFLFFREVDHQINEIRRHNYSQVESEFKKNTFMPKPNSENNVELSTEPANNTSQDREKNPDATDKKINIKQLMETLSKLPVFSPCSEIESIFSGKVGDKLQSDLVAGDLKRSRLFRKTLRLFTRTASSSISWKFSANQKFYLLSDSKPYFDNSLEYLRAMFEARDELLHNLQYARNLENITYRTYIIALVLFERPSLIGDSSVIRSCREAELVADIKTGTIDIEKLNGIVDNILARAQIKPEEIEFDRSWQSDLTVEMTKYGPVYSKGLQDKLKE